MSRNKRPREDVKREAEKRKGKIGRDDGSRVVKLDCPNRQNLGLINTNLESEKVLSNRFISSFIKVKIVLPNVEYSTVKYHQLLDSLLPPHLSVKTRQHKAGAEKFGGRPCS